MIRLPFRPFFILIVFALCAAQVSAFAQAPDSAVQSAYSGVLFIPAQWDEVSPNAIQTQVADRFNEQAHDVEDLYVADWWWIEEIIDEEGYRIDQAIDPSLALEFGEACEVGEVFLFDIVQFTQAGVSETSDQAKPNFFIRVVSGFFKALFEDKPADQSDPNYDNIRTDLTIRIRMIDVNNAELKETFSIAVSYIGGVREASREHALEQLGENIASELRRRYTPGATIARFDHTKLVLDGGWDAGVLRGRLFEIFAPDYVDQTAADNRIIYGRSAGYAKITFADSAVSRAELLRQWAPVDTGFSLMALNRMVQGVVVSASIPVGRNYPGLALQFNYQSVQKYDGGAEIRVFRAEDNFKNTNWGVGFGGYGSWRFLNLPRFALKARLDADLDIFFRLDDEDDFANLPLFSLSPGMSAEFLIAPTSDLVVQTGYRIWGKSNNWQKSGEEDETVDAFWESNPPKINLSGLFLKIGYRFHFRQ